MKEQFWQILENRLYIFYFCLISALEITGENLEDLLAYDDLFLDYFNAFLALPVSTSCCLQTQSEKIVLTHTQLRIRSQYEHNLIRVPAEFIWIAKVSSSDQAVQNVQADLSLQWALRSECSMSDL